MVEKKQDIVKTIKKIGKKKKENKKKSGKTY